MLSLTYLVIAQAPSVLNCSSTLCQRLPACKLFFLRGKVCKQAIGVAKEIKEMSQLSAMIVCVCLCDILTISAVWFLLRTALCRAVMPSFVLKSRCAPPLLSTLMSSAHPSSCAASVRGHSVKSKDKQAYWKTMHFQWQYCAFFFRKWTFSNRSWSY